MTIKDLNEILGKQIMEVRAEGLSPDAKNDVYKQAETVAKLAKQIINAADVALRYEVATSKNLIDEISVVHDIVEGET